MISALCASLIAILPVTIQEPESGIFQELRVTLRDENSQLAIPKNAQMFAVNKPARTVQIRVKDFKNLHQVTRLFDQQPGVLSVKAYIPRLLDLPRLKETSTAIKNSTALFQKAVEIYNTLPIENRITENPTRSLKRPPGLGYMEEYAEWFESRTYPTGRYDYSLIQEGRDAKDRLASPKIAMNWTYIGPTNLQSYSQTGFGPAPINGRVNGLAFDPFNGQRAFAATALGGVWVTNDGGVNWLPLGDFWQEIATSVVTVNPSIQHHAYVGTGDHPGSRGRGLGIFFTSNGGTTWVQRGFNQLSDCLVTDIVVDPENPSSIFVSSGGGGDSTNELWYSPDEGVNWQKTIDEDVHWTDLDVGVASGTTQYIYAAGHTSSTNRVLYRTSNNGNDWESLSLPSGIEGDRVYIACSRLVADKVYIYYTNSRRVWHNKGRSGTWEEITDDLATVSDGNWGQTSYNNGLLCFRRELGASDKDALILQGIDMWLSPEAEGEWESIGQAYTGDDKVHVDNHFITQHPNEPTLFLSSNDGGVYTYSFNHASGVGNFTPINRRLGCTLVSRIALDPNDKDVMIAGLQDNGFANCNGDIANWGSLYGGDAGHAAINQTAPGYQYLMPPNFQKDSVTGDGFILGTSNSWVNRTEIPINTLGEKHRSSPPIVISDLAPRYVYVGTNYVHRYDEVTDTWSMKLGNQLLSATKHIRHLAVAPTNASKIYTVAQDGEVWASHNGGANWTRIDTGNPGLPVESISHVSVDPKNPNSILVGCESTANACRLWECKNVLAVPRVWIAREGIINNKKLPRVPITAIQRHPLYPSTAWFVATNIGVFNTVDSGKNWNDFSPIPHFPTCEVWDLKIQKKTGYIYAATWGRGIWRTKVPNIIGDLSP